MPNNKQCFPWSYLKGRPRTLNIKVHAGHGLDFKTTKILTKIKEIEEFNIGHFIISESLFLGLKSVIKKFKKVINT